MLNFIFLQRCYQYGCVPKSKIFLRTRIMMLHTHTQWGRKRERNADAEQTKFIRSISEIQTKLI